MKSVMQKMEDKTVIAIAHRLNSIAGFDRIILFREGKIVGQGTFEELLRTDLYDNLDVIPFDKMQKFFEENGVVFVDE